MSFVWDGPNSVVLARVRHDRVIAPPEWATATLDLQRF